MRPIRTGALCSGFLGSADLRTDRGITPVCPDDRDSHSVNHTLHGGGNPSSLLSSWGGPGGSKAKGAGQHLRKRASRMPGSCLRAVWRLSLRWIRGGARRERSDGSAATGSPSLTSAPDVGSQPTWRTSRVMGRAPQRSSQTIWRTTGHFVVRRDGTPQSCQKG